MEEIVEQVKEKVENVVVEKADVVIDKVEEFAEKIDNQVDAGLKKLDEKAPEVASVVEAVDAALMGKTCSCMVFGWKISASKVALARSK